MNKRLTAINATGALAAGIVVGASANGIIQKVQSELRGDFVIKTNGQVQTLKNVNGETVYPMLYERTTYLPVRAYINYKKLWHYTDIGSALENVVFRNSRHNNYLVEYKSM